MITEGKYLARARDWALSLTSTNKEQIGVAFEILQGEFAGQYLTWYGFFTDATFERTLESLRACGWLGSDLAEIDGLDTNDVQIVVEHEVSEKDGNTYPKVRWVNKLRGVALKNQLDAHQAKTFAARMKGHILAFDKSAGAPRSSTPAPRPPNSQRSGARSSYGPPEPPPHDDSDLPPF